MTAFFSGLLSFFKGLAIVWEIIKTAISLGKTINERNEQRKTDRAVDAIYRNDNIEVERNIGNPNAGKPSGIGDIREPKH